MLGVVGVLVPLVGRVAAIGLAKPNSPWARRRYVPAAGSSRAVPRHERHTRRYQRFSTTSRARRHVRRSRKLPSPPCWTPSAYRGYDGRNLAAPERYIGVLVAARDWTAERLPNAAPIGPAVRPWTITLSSTVITITRAASELGLP